MIEDLLHWIDQRRRPLQWVVPNLEELLADPTTELKAEEIVIPAAPFPGMSLLLGLMFTFPLLFCVFTPVWIIVSRWPEPYREVAVHIAMITSLVLGVYFANRWLRRRKIVLRLQGVEIHCGGKYVFCPWALFCVPVEALSEADASVILAVNPGSIPSVELRRKGKILATGKAVRTTDFHFKQGMSAVLADVFQARVGPVAKLLIGVGRRMGNVYWVTLS